MAEKVTMINGAKRRHRVEVFVLGPESTILVSSRGVGKYPELPGGGVDEGESIVESAMREVAEEAGWTVTDPYEVRLHTPYIFKGMDCGWFNRDGWKEEENLAVACLGLVFSPGPAFGSEGDQGNYQMVPVRQLIDDCRTALANGLNERHTMAAHFRLGVLGRLFPTLATNKVTLVDFNTSKGKPTWESWK